jgi:hypothetical protein
LGNIKKYRDLSQILTVEAVMYAIDENYPKMLESSGEFNALQFLKK